MKKYLLLCAVALLPMLLPAQAGSPRVLKFDEYLTFVKKFHPVAKQAELAVDAGQANLQKARGGFDPRLEVDYAKKEFKDTEYYDRLRAAVKIPTWYGLELKGSFDQVEGAFINPDETLPTDGLYSAGLKLSLARGLWINERMATLKQARLFREQAKAERDLLVNEILFRASLAYFDWLYAYNEVEIYRVFLNNAATRFQGIQKSAAAGDIAAIDTLEANIAVQDRALNLEQARIRMSNKALELSNFLWLDDNVPVELQDDVIPDLNPEADIDPAFEIMGKPLDSFPIENHPKLRALGYKIESLEVEKRLKTNQLLPKIDLEYNFITETPEYLNTFETQDYKGGLSVYFPLFLRKERGELRMSRVKLEDAQYELDNAQIQLKNKILAIYRELESFQTQNALIKDMVASYRKLLAAEERKFNFGESSLFIVNSRESKLIDAERKQNEVQNKFFIAKAKLFNSIAINPADL
jgi:outer membrane protein TolC